jgi:GWxTD domain-containing protein
MRLPASRSFLLFLVSASLLAAAPLPQLFHKAKEQFRLGGYADALQTLATIEAEVEKPENQSQRAGLRPGLAFYRGACLAALGRDNEAREEFRVFLAFSPGASLDPGLYPKKVIAVLEETRRDLKRANEQPAQPQEPAQDGSVAAAYRAYLKSSEGRQPELGEDWADGPVRHLLTSEERRTFTQLYNPVSRSEFVTAFWRARDPRPETVENEFRDEFEKRVAFADSHFTDDELRGSLTDRGMVFVLLGPPTYIGRRPIGAGEDSGDAPGMSLFSRHDIEAVEKIGGSNAKTNVAIDTMTGPSNTILDSSASWREIWHYRKELLPKSVPYHQVDFEFITRKGYGKNVLQRESAVLNSLDAARQAIVVDRSPRRAAR